MAKVVALVPSPHLDTLPELTAPDRSRVIVERDAFDDWYDVFDRWPGADDYLVSPGDYRTWGPCVIDRTYPPNHRRTIRFIDTDRKPWDRPTEEAVTAGFGFTAGAAHWIVHGLTLRGPNTSPCWVRPGAKNVTFDSLLIEDFPTYGVRLFGDHCTVQNSVIRRMSRRKDGVAVQVKVRGVPNVGNRVLDNEIYDCNDSVAVTWDQHGADPFLECRDLLVEGNDFYLTEDRHVVLPDDLFPTGHDGVGVYATAENGIDIKAGPRTVPEPIRFSRNRIWGFRRTLPLPDGPASDGAAITIHRAAQRILLDHNVIFDCPIALHEVVRDKEDPNRSNREVTVRSNIVAYTRRYNPDDPGAVLRTKLPFSREGNQFSHNETLSTLPKHDRGDTYVDNVLYETELGEAAADWTPENNQQPPASGMSDVVIELRRWTNPGTVIDP